MKIVGSKAPGFTRRLSIFVSRELTRRDSALDAFRGLMILGMILVNHPPPTMEIYPPLVHALWHGWTLADTIFPGFLFAVGFSLHLANVKPRDKRAASVTYVYIKILRRFALLMALNFLLMNFPYYFAGQICLSGTLALIAWCYVIVAVIYLHTDWRVQLALVSCAITVQWAAYTFFPIPGFGPGQLTPEANFARYLDEVVIAPLFGSANNADDSGAIVLPLVGSAATTLIGLLAGQWMGGSCKLSMRIVGLFGVGLGLFALGSAWHLQLPVNKHLWTGSFVLLMAGISMQILAVFYGLIDYVCYRSWAKPLQVAGVNALFFYVFAQSLQRLLVYGRIRSDDGTVLRLRQLIYTHYFPPWMYGEFGSLAFALIFLLICYAMVFILYRKRIFFKL